MNADLLADLASAPELPGAACKGSTAWDLVDYNEPRDRERAAQAVCLKSCPVLASCLAALLAAPRSQWPEGVVAGRVLRKRDRANAN